MRRRLAALVVAGPLLAGAAGAEEPSLPRRLVPRELLAPGIALGAPLLLSAERLEYDETTGVFVAEGNVEAGLGNRTIRADRIRYDSRNGTAEFAGRVHYKEQGDEFSFDRIVVDVDRQLGVLYNGWIRITSNHYQIASRQFEKTGERTFVVREGSLTTCPCEPECDWKFTVGRTRVTIDGYAVGRNVTFRVRGVPVLWLPWGAFPVKVSRQTGLLLPDFANTSLKGTQVVLPFYWAISRWTDATLTMDWMSKRGLRPEGELRYAINPLSEGAVRYTQFQDKVARRSRFRAYGENVFDQADRWSLNARWDIVSDDGFYKDLVDDDILRTGRHVPTRAAGAVRSGHAAQSLAVHWIEDLQGIPDDNTVQRLPEYSASVIPVTLRRTGLDLSGGLVGTRFDRRGSVPEWRGRGHAELSRPIAVYRSVVLTPHLGFDALGDYLDNTAAADRRSGRVLAEAGAFVAGEWTRAYERASGRRVVHAIRPSAGFRWVSAEDQSDIPLTDAWARVASQQQFLFSVAQRLLRLTEGQGPAEIAFLEVDWAYDLAGRERPDSPYVDPLSPYYRALRDQIDLVRGAPARADESASDVHLRLGVHPGRGWSLGGESLFDPSDTRFTLAAGSAEWTRGKKTRVFAEYRRYRELSEDLHGILELRPLRFLGVRGEANYSIRLEELIRGTAGVVFHPRSECWSVGLSVERKTKPDDTSIKFAFTLRGIGGYGNR